MNRSRFRHAGWLLVACTLVLAGCPPRREEPVVCGPPLPEAELIRLHNENADKVPSLRARADVEVTWRCEGQERTERLRDGLLLLLKPEGQPDAVPSFMLRAVMVSEPYFGAGVDAAAGEYYFWLDPPRGEGLARWGLLADIDRLGYETLPIDPVDLLGVLAVLPWPLRQPGQPVLLLPKDDPCLYDMLFFGGGASDQRVRLRRQVWLDRAGYPPRPTRVWVFDSAGRVTVEATLAKYKRIENPRLSGRDWPVMPSDILLRYPRQEEFISLRLRLSDMTVATEGSPVRPEMFVRRSVVPGRIDDQRPLGPLPEGPAAPPAEPAPRSGEAAP